MSRYIFLFDLDSTVTKEEILPAVLRKTGILERTSLPSESTVKGELPFQQSFLQRVDMLKDIPVSEVCQMVSEIPFNKRIVDFIQDNRNRCYIVTENLDVWIRPLIERLVMENHTFCSNALMENHSLQGVINIVDKNAVVSQMMLPIVAVGAGNNDAEMIEAAEIGIGYGGVQDVAPSVLECASHVIYDENKLAEFLQRLL